MGARCFFLSIRLDSLQRKVTALNLVIPRVCNFIGFAKKPLLKTNSLGPSKMTKNQKSHRLRPERSVVEGPAVRLSPKQLPPHSTFHDCHPACRGACGGSAVRGPLFLSVHPIGQLQTKVTALNFVIPTGAKRSGGTCCAPFPQTTTSALYLPRLSSRLPACPALPCPERKSNGTLRQAQVRLCCAPPPKQLPARSTFQTLSSL